MLRCKEGAQQRNLTEKKFRSKEVSQQKSPTSKKSHSKEISQQRNLTAKKLTAKKSHSKEISQQKSLTAKKPHIKEISQQKDFTAKTSHSQEVPQQRSLTAKTSHIKGCALELTAQASLSRLERSKLKQSLSRKLCFHIFTFHFFEGRLARKLRFHNVNFHLQLSLFEGSLARKLRFHKFNFHFLRNASHESFVFTSSTFIFWRKSPFSHLQLSLFVRSLELADTPIVVFCKTKRASEGGWGRSAARRFRNTLGCRRIMLGSVPWWNWQFKLHFHNFNFPDLREGSHESFVFTSSTFTFWGRPRTKASFSQVQLSLFEASLARKLRFHKFNFHFLREVLHESFGFTSLTFFNFQCLREILHESFVFTSSTSTFWRKSPFLRISGCTNCCVLQNKTCLGRRMGKGATVSEHARLWSDHARIRSALQLLLHASIRHLGSGSAISGAVVRSSMVLCNSVSAGRRVMAACGCVRDNMVFCSWASWILLGWLHHGCAGDLSAVVFLFRADAFHFVRFF